MKTVMCWIRKQNDKFNNKMSTSKNKHIYIYITEDIGHGQQQTRERAKAGIQKMGKIYNIYQDWLVSGKQGWVIMQCKVYRRMC